MKSFFNLQRFSLLSGILLSPFFKFLLLIHLVNGQSPPPPSLPTNLPFPNLTSSYLPFTSVSTSLLLSNPAYSQPILSSSSGGLTIFLLLDLPFHQLVTKGFGPGIPGQLITASFLDQSLTAALAGLLVLPPANSSSSSSSPQPRTSGDFNGTNIYPTLFTDPAYTHLSPPGTGNVVKITRNSTTFTLESGIGFVSNVVIPDIPFTNNANGNGNGNGIIHIIDSPIAPPYTVNETGIIFGIEEFTASLSPEILNNASDVTVFSPPPPSPPGSSSGGMSAGLTPNDYVVVGAPVLYTPRIKNGMTATAVSGRVLHFEVDDDDDDDGDGEGVVKVEGVAIGRTRDLITRSGVVHILEGTF